MTYPGLRLHADVALWAGAQQRERGLERGGCLQRPVRRGVDRKQRQRFADHRCQGLLAPQGHPVHLLLPTCQSEASIQRKGTVEASE